MSTAIVIILIVAGNLATAWAAWISGRATRAARLEAAEEAGWNACEDAILELEAAVGARPYGAPYPAVCDATVVAELVEPITAALPAVRLDDDDPAIMTLVPLEAVPHHDQEVDAPASPPLQRRGVIIHDGQEVDAAAGAPLRRGGVTLHHDTSHLYEELEEYASGPRTVLAAPLREDWDEDSLAFLRDPDGVLTAHTFTEVAMIARDAERASARRLPEPYPEPEAETTVADIASWAEELRAKLAWHEEDWANTMPWEREDQHTRVLVGA